MNKIKKKEESCVTEPTEQAVQDKAELIYSVMHDLREKCIRNHENFLQQEVEIYVLKSMMSSLLYEYDDEHGSNLIDKIDMDEIFENASKHIESKYENVKVMRVDKENMQ